MPDWFSGQTHFSNNVSTRVACYNKAVVVDVSTLNITHFRTSGYEDKRKLRSVSSIVMQSFVESDRCLLKR